MAPATDLPEAATRRLGDTVFSSGLSVPDFAACLSMGLRPLGLVQGFCALHAGWSYSGVGLGALTAASPAGAYSETFSCPHGVMLGGEHRVYGQNYEVVVFEEAWATGYHSALARMVDEATALGAHGVLGVLDTETALADTGVTEFHVRGTAVAVEGADAPTAVWTTALAGQRLVKAFEIGYAPVSVVATMALVRLWAGCVAEYQLEGNALYFSGEPTEITQVVLAKSAARHVAREQLRRQLGTDDLHGVSWWEGDREVGQGAIDFRVVARGNRLRRAGDAVAMPAPQSVRVLR